MGQKINPRSMRLQVDHDWQSRWYADRDYATLLQEDMRIRELVARQLSNASVSQVEQVKARLLQRDLGHVERNGKRYRDIRDALRTRQVEESLNNLSQAATKLFGKDAQAREVMTHLKRDIADYLRFHLLAVAAGQAVEVMRGMSAWLGDPLSLDEHGQPEWSGIAGEFQEGRRCVQAMLGAVDQRIGQLRADAQHEHATYIKLASDVLPEPVKLTGDISAWSEEVLLEFGGSSRLFPQLGDDRLPAGAVGTGELLDPDGRAIARGLVNYDAAELPPLLGRSTRELARELGASYEREVVHRDDLVLL